MGSRGSDYRRRRESLLDLYKDTANKWKKVADANYEFSGKNYEEWEENVEKLKNKGKIDDYFDWLGKGQPDDWPSSAKSSEPEPEPENSEIEPEPERTAGESQTETQPETPADSGSATNSIDSERMQNGFYAKNAKEADSMLLPETQRVWSSLTDPEKIIVRSYSGKLAGELNSYLWSGIEKHGGYDNITDTYYEGDVHQPLDLLTSALNKSSLQQDTWLERGIPESHLLNFFGISNVSEIDDLIADKKVVTHKGFMSTSSGSIAGSMANWAGDVKLKVFAPKGTKGMYINPVSKYGDKLLDIGFNTVSTLTGTKKVSKIIKDWDGKTSKASGAEIETILQRGLDFMVIGQEKENGKLVVTIAVVN